MTTSLTQGSFEISPSKIGCMAIGKGPAKGIPAATAGACAMCGQHHEAGTEVVAFKPPDSFTDWAALKTPTSKVICRWCAQVSEKFWMQKCLKSIVTMDGVFKAASNEDLAYWLTNPPQNGPWLFLQGDQQMQHVIWRAPVNWSPLIFQIRAGETILTIRHEHLMQGIESAKALTEKANELQKLARKGKRGAPFKSPFVVLDRDRQALSQGTLRTELMDHAKEDAQTAAHIRNITQMTPGELWALTSVLYAANTKPSEPISYKD